MVTLVTLSPFGYFRDIEQLAAQLAPSFLQFGRMKPLELFRIEELGVYKALEDEVPNGVARAAHPAGSLFSHAVLQVYAVSLECPSLRVVDPHRDLPAFVVNGSNHGSPHYSCFSCGGFCLNQVRGSSW